MSVLSYLKVLALNGTFLGNIHNTEKPLSVKDVEIARISIIERKFAKCRNLISIKLN